MKTLSKFWDIRPISKIWSRSTDFWENNIHGFLHQYSNPFWSYHSVDSGYPNKMALMAWTWTTMRRSQGHLLQRDLLGLVAFLFVSYALCSFLQQHSYPCLNSHVWIVLLGNEQLVELLLELGNGPLHWISFLHPKMILGHDYGRNNNILKHAHGTQCVGYI